MRIPQWVATVSIETFGLQQIHFRTKNDKCWKTLILILRSFRSAYYYILFFFYSACNY